MMYMWVEPKHLAEAVKITSNQKPNVVPINLKGIESKNVMYSKFSVPNGNNVGFSYVVFHIPWQPFWIM